MNEPRHPCCLDQCQVANHLGRSRQSWQSLCCKLPSWGSNYQNQVLLHPWAAKHAAWPWSHHFMDIAGFCSSLSHVLERLAELTQARKGSWIFWKEACWKQQHRMEMDNKTQDKTRQMQEITRNGSCWIKDYKPWKQQWTCGRVKLVGL